MRKSADVLNDTSGDTIILDLPPRHHMYVSVFIVMPFLFLTSFPSSILNYHDDAAAEPLPNVQYSNPRTMSNQFCPVLVLL